MVVERVQQDIDRIRNTIFNIINSSEEEIFVLNGSLIGLSQPMKFEILVMLYARVQNLETLRKALKNESRLFLRDGKKYIVVPDGAGGYEIEVEEDESVITVSISSPMGKELLQR